MKIDQNCIRLDKWLWTARFYTTRKIASLAIKTCKVRVNQVPAKSARLIHPGDRLMIEKNGFNYEVDVLSILSHRVSAKRVNTLYKETTLSVEKRQIKQTQRRLAALLGIKHPQSRPGKHARRKLEALKRGGC